MANIKPIALNMDPKDALRRAMSVPAPEADPKPPKPAKAAAKKKTAKKPKR